MVSETDDPPDPAAKPIPRRRPRPAPTIDLQATEVASHPQEKAPPAPDAAADRGGRRQQPDAKAAPAKSAIPGAGIGASEARREPPPPPNGKSPPRAPRRWPLAAAGAVGGGLVLLLVAMLWLATPPSPREGRSAALNSRLARVETRMREFLSAPADADRKSLDELSSRVAKLETAVTAPQPAGDPAMAKRLADVEAAVKSLAGNVADLSRRADPSAERAAVEALSNRVAALEQATKATADEVAKGPTAAGDRQARLAVAAQALRAAVERGEPFVAELAAVKPMTPDPQMLTPLEPFAASGLPSPAVLARELSELAPTLSPVAAAPPPESGFLNRLQASAARLVRVRPIDETPGDDPAAIVARIEAEAARSDIAGALADLAKLPQPLSAPTQEWVKKAQARRAALEASRRLAGDALGAIAKPSP